MKAQEAEAERKAAEMARERARQEAEAAREQARIEREAEIEKQRMQREADRIEKQRKRDAERAAKDALAAAEKLQQQQADAARATTSASTAFGTFKFGQIRSGAGTQQTNSHLMSIEATLKALLAKLQEAIQKVGFN